MPISIQSVFKRILRILLRGALGILLFIITYVVSAYILSIIPTDKEYADNSSVVIYILSNGVHTDIVVPVQSNTCNWSECISYSNTKACDSSAGWLAFGWGDKGFYLETPTWGDLKFSTAFKAAFALSNSAVHTTYYKDMKEHTNCKRISISEDQYKRLVTYIKASMEWDEHGRSKYINTTANYNNYDAFYEAKGSYSLFHTCNTWANNGLKACGQKACLWTPFDKGIFYHYR